MPSSRLRLSVTPSVLPILAPAPAHRSGRRSPRRVLRAVACRVLVLLFLPTQVAIASPSAWQSLGVATTQLPSKSAFAIDTRRYRLVMFGGDLSVNEVHVGTTWAFDQHGGPASGVVPRAPGDPAGRGEAAMIYDPIGDRMILFGGGHNGYFDDVWQRTQSDGAWTQLFPSGTPGARRGMGAVYDPVRHRMIVVGGASALGRLNDVWALSLDGPPAWTRITPSGTPPSERDGLTLTYDSLRDRILLFGGADSHGSSNEVWALTLDSDPAWSRFYPEVLGTTARTWATAVYDPVRDRLVVWGGNGIEQGPRALSLTAPISWSDVDLSGTSGPPAWREGQASFYDPTRDRLFICGGGGYDDSWVLEFGSTPTAVEPGLPAHLAIDRLVRAGDGTIQAAISLVAGGGLATLEVFDVGGRRVAAARVSPGTREVSLGAADAVRDGVFFARLTQGPHSVTRVAALLR